MELLKEIEWIAQKSDLFGNEIAYNYIDLTNKLIEQIDFLTKRK